MATINVKTKKEKVFTHEGAKAIRISNFKILERSVLSCMLWEDEFYEDGEIISNRIENIIENLPEKYLDKVADLAIKARNEYYLRHAPLLIICALLKRKYPVANIIYKVIQRADELTELLAIYWRNGKTPLANQLKKGLAMAFTKFNEYELAKYNRDKDIKLRDVLFLTHVKPKEGLNGFNKEARKAGSKFPTDSGSQLYRKLVEDSLVVPDTWEVELSKSKDKKESWERLIKEGKLGGLATLRNLRNMQEAKVEEDLIKEAITKANYNKVLPFRFIAAARYAPNYEEYIEQVMLKSISESEKLKGTTILLIDVSGSMDAQLSGKSDMRRMDAGFGLGIILREICEDIKIYTFSDRIVQIPSRHGFALRDTMDNSQSHNCTYLGKAINLAKQNNPLAERLIVISDEQSHDTIPNVEGKNYMINVASNKNGVGYGKWVHIDGFSEAVVKYIIEYEKQEND